MEDFFVQKNRRAAACLRTAAFFAVLACLSLRPARAAEWRRLDAFAGKQGVWRIRGERPDPGVRAAEERSPGRIPPFYQVGFDRLEFDLYTGTSHGARLTLYLGDADGDRLTAAVPGSDAKAPAAAPWRHVVLEKKAFHLWPMTGNHRADWDAVTGVVFTLVLEVGGRADFALANLRWYAHESREMYEVLRPRPRIGGLWNIGDHSLWAGPPPRLPSRDKSRDRLVAGAASVWLLGDNGVQLAADLRRRFPDADIVLAGNGMPTLRAPFYIRKFRSMGVFYQAQKTGPDLEALAAHHALYSDWRGKEPAPFGLPPQVLATNPLAQQDLKRQRPGLRVRDPGKSMGPRAKAASACSQ